MSVDPRKVLPTAYVRRRLEAILKLADSPASRNHPDPQGDAIETVRNWVQDLTPKKKK